LGPVKISKIDIFLPRQAKHNAGKSTYSKNKTYTITHQYMLENSQLDQIALFSPSRGQFY